ncbi:MAG: hypothetical protein SGBAC_012420 [Bacillariaceae sp.]
MASTEADHADVVTPPSSSDVKTADEDPVVAVTTSNDEGSAVVSAVVSDTKEDKKGSPDRGSNSPAQSTSGYPQALPAHLTPQPQAYYYSQTQVTPEPPSPAGATGYDVGAFLQPAAYGSPFGGVHVHQYSTAAQQPPNSPSHTATGSLTGVPPASPLFPTLSGQPTHGLLDHHHMFDGSMQQHAPGSPGPHYLSPGLGSVPNEFPGWTDNRNHQQTSYPPGSPAQGMPVPYVPGMPPRTAQGRSYSFEETMLPPSMESQQDQNYSTYGSSPNSTGGHFQHQQAPQWGYPTPDMYGMTAVSPLQPRPTMNYPGMPGGGRVPGQPIQNYGGQFYPNASPGPPIQTTASNKGPDGANLFIFHIPNHFSNMDMYHLFSPFGTLLSVRIMVEKESGRSRGFGFVSYDSPDAAAIAIKELNGYTIGNKRLKVQHKQIRSAEQQERPGQHGGGGYNHAGGQHGGGGGGNYGGRGYMPSSLPPSGPMAMSSGWYQSNAGNIETAANQDVVDEPEDGAGPSSFSSMDPLRQSLPEVEGAD